MKQQEANEQTTSYFSDVIVDAVWDSYAAMLSFTRKNANASEEAVINAWGETYKWLGEQRQTATTALQDAVEKNGGPFAAAGTTLQNLATKAESVLEQGRTEFVKTQHERRDAFWGLHDEFAAMLKENQRTFFRVVEDSVRPFARA